MSLSTDTKQNLLLIFLKITLKDRVALNIRPTKLGNSRTLERRFFAWLKRYRPHVTVINFGTFCNFKKDYCLAESYKLWLLSCIEKHCCYHISVSKRVFQVSDILLWFLEKIFSFNEKKKKKTEKLNKSRKLFSQ